MSVDKVPDIKTLEDLLLRGGEGAYTVSHELIDLGKKKLFEDVVRLSRQLGVKISVPIKNEAVLVVEVRETIYKNGADGWWLPSKGRKKVRVYSQTFHLDPDFLILEDMSLIKLID